MTRALLISDTYRQLLNELKCELYLLERGLITKRIFEMNIDYLTDKAMSRVAGGLLITTDGTRSITAVFYCESEGHTKEVVQGKGLVSRGLIPRACPT